MHFELFVHVRTRAILACSSDRNMFQEYWEEHDANSEWLIVLLSKITIVFPLSWQLSLPRVLTAHPSPLTTHPSPVHTGHTHPGDPSHSHRQGTSCSEKGETSAENSRQKVAHIHHYEYCGRANECLARMLKKALPLHTVHMARMLFIIVMGSHKEGSCISGHFWLRSIL